MTDQKQVFIEEKVSSLMKNHELLPITSKAKKHNPNFFIKSGLIQGSKDLTRAEELYHLQRLAKNNSDSIGLENINYFFCNTPVSSIRQGSNPICGLVALSMAINMLQEETHHVENLLSHAVDLNLTKKGEIFSVYSMKQLIQDHYNLEAKVQVFNQTRIAKKLACGIPILVPYDSDKNHSPCLKKGHCAHWAVLTGIASCTHYNIWQKNNALLLEPANVFKIEGNEFQKVFDGSSACQLWVFAKQGKSSKLAMWSLDELEASNKNLIERNPDKDWQQFHCPFDLSCSLSGLVVELN